MWCSDDATFDKQRFITFIRIILNSLPVFMISAYGDADTVATALARGADEFLTKPVDFPKLKQDIMAVMADATGGNG